MRNRQTRSEAAQAASERRAREDSAPRLKDRVTRLEELSIEVAEYRGDNAVVGGRYTRRIVVAQAPAMFELPCTEERCVGGGYDVTSQVMRGLADECEEFEGEDACMGALGGQPCGRTLRFVAHAAYRPR